MPKTDIHPKYHEQAKVSCACGETFMIGATREELNVEVCSACHPFYTGEKKLMDVAGRVERFKSRAAKKEDEPQKKKVRAKKQEVPQKGR